MIVIIIEGELKYSFLLLELMAEKVGLPREVFVNELKSDELNNRILELRRVNVIHEGRGERTLQMYCCFYLLTNLFFSKKSNWSFRPLIVEERANDVDSEIGDIMLISDLPHREVDVWVEIKNYFGNDKLTESMRAALTKDFNKCMKAITNGAIGVVMFTFDDKILGEKLISDISTQFPQVELVVIGSD